VLLTFSPPAVTAYEASLSFVVNGLWNVEVKVCCEGRPQPQPQPQPQALAPALALTLTKVRGEGCELKLELVEPQQQQLALGAVPVYQQAGSTYICMMGGICMAGWLYLYIYI
jgi:hypothetical protein